MNRLRDALLAAFVLAATYFAARANQAIGRHVAKITLGEVQFEDIASASGVSALNTYGGDSHKEFIIETNGNGAVIFDYDNDGWPDYYTVREGSGVDKAATREPSSVRLSAITKTK